jgi:hypothetical protein
MKRETSSLSGALGEGLPNESSGFCDTKISEPTGLEPFLGMLLICNVRSLCPPILSTGAYFWAQLGTREIALRLLIFPRMSR